MKTASPTQQRGPRRVYANEAIEAHWEPKLCIHSGNCTRRLGEVFKRNKLVLWTSMSA